METPETRVVPDGVEGVSGERVRQLTAEEVEDAIQSPEKTAEAVTLVPRERVQQRTAEEVEDAIHFS